MSGELERLRVRGAGRVLRLKGQYADMEIYRQAQLELRRYRLNFLQLLRVRGRTPSARITFNTNSERRCFVQFSVTG